MSLAQLRRGISDRGFGPTQVLLSLCELSLREGKLNDAEELAREALQRAAQDEDVVNIPEAYVWLGRIADLRGEHQVADREFEQAISRFELLGLSDRLLHTHGVYAEVLERRGELAKAYGHMKQALQASRPRPAGRTQEEKRLSSA